MTKALIVGCSGPELTPEEVAFLREEDPWGLILFARNCPSPTSVEALVAAFREVVGREDAPVLIDQEGGRVQRLKPPYWSAYPSGAAIEALYRRDPDAGRQAARLAGRLIAEDLRLLGITVDCLPVLDVRCEGTHDVIGDRAYGSDAKTVVTLGRAVTEGLRSGGVAPVMKHVPGHGRAGADSHLELPVVDAALDDLRAVDFAPFAELADLPMAMTAHVLYTALDPDRCATLSPSIVGDVIRGEIGFDGLLMSDDLSMKALQGSLSRANGSRDFGWLRRRAPLQRRSERNARGGRGQPGAVRPGGGAGRRRARLGPARLDRHPRRARRSSPAAGRGDGVRA